MSPDGDAEARRSAATLRVLIASHSHPRLQNGGSEVASYALFTHLRARSGVQAAFCGCSRTAAYARAGQTITQPFGDDDYLYSIGAFDWFRFANRDPGFADDFRALLRELAPQVVHFHHYIGFGLEALAHVREICPESRLIVTLHEFLAICHQQGQMVTTAPQRLCYRATPQACSACFPEIPPAAFFLRRLYAERFFSQVDHFIAPSHFLAERYVAWGLPRERISVIENVPAANPAPKPSLVPRGSDGVLRVGYFGQISSLKGIEVLLDAASLLHRERRHDVVFEIYGDPGGQPPEFQAAFSARLEQLPPTVRFHGPYDNDRVNQLMDTVDLVVVPSLWWENAPVVIQEAYRNGRPVLCSNVGGMAEKVVAGETGLHFAMGSPLALANTLQMLAEQPETLARLAAGAARAATTIGDTLDAHLRLYRGRPEPGGGRRGRNLMSRTSRTAYDRPVDQLKR